MLGLYIDMHMLHNIYQTVRRNVPGYRIVFRWLCNAVMFVLIGGNDASGRTASSPVLTRLSWIALTFSFGSCTAPDINMDGCAFAAQAAHVNMECSGLALTRVTITFPPTMGAKEQLTSV